MFIYVFSEVDRDKLTRRGFAYMGKDDGAKAFVFVNDPHLSLPDGIEAVVSSRLTFSGQKDNNTKGGGRNGTA